MTAKYSDDNNMTTASSTAVQDNDSSESAVVLYYEEYKPPFLMALILAFPIMPLFWTYSVKVTKSHLSFGYSSYWTSKTSTLSNIMDAKPIHNVNGLWNWGGWGIRLRPGRGSSSSSSSSSSNEDQDENQSTKSYWETGYIAKNGGAVQVTLRDADNDNNDEINSNDNVTSQQKQYTYVFSCENPEKVCKILTDSM